jgi:4-hydroxy-tetrahydrodipicolinate reductase
MNVLVLGRGKTGSLIAEVARHRNHQVEVLCSADNPHASALTPSRLSKTDAVIDFTTPHAVLENIEACIAAGKQMVVGTTGWYGELPRIQKLVEKHGTGFLHAANFSIGVNLFFDVAKAAGAALKHQYSGQIFERHHAQKKDAPSGTAITLQKIVYQTSGTELEITCTNSPSTRRMTRCTFATMRNPAAASPKAPCVPPNGSPQKRAFSTSKTSGGNCKESRIRDILVSCNFADAVQH